VKVIAFSLISQTYKKFKKSTVNSQETVLLTSEIRQHEVSGDISMMSTGTCGSTGGDVCHSFFVFSRMSWTCKLLTHDIVQK
jgi:hypothetical protein